MIDALCCVTMVALLRLLRFQVATSAYCIAIAHLVHHQKDAAGSLAAAQDWLQQGLAAALQAATPACSTRSSACGAAYCSNRSTVSMAGSVASSSGCGSREHCDSPRDVQVRCVRFRATTQV